jgi:hypothetical protein
MPKLDVPLQPARGRPLRVITRLAKREAVRRAFVVTYVEAWRSLTHERTCLPSVLCPSRNTDSIGKHMVMRMDSTRAYAVTCRKL